MKILVNNIKKDCYGGIQIKLYCLITFLFSVIFF